MVCCCTKFLFYRISRIYECFTSIHMDNNF